MYEKNVYIKDWRTIDITLGLIYPNKYSLGMSSYSIRLLYNLFNQYENIACERIFLPEKIKFPASIDYSSDIRSLENQIQLNLFDILGFSIQFENDFKNILWIIDKAGIPLSSEERQKLREDEKEYIPLIIGGGPVATSNPLPLSKFFDLFFIGDAEPVINKFLQEFLRFKKSEINFRNLLTNLKNLNGIYIPKLRNSVNRVILEDLDLFPIPYYQLRTASEVETLFEGSFFLELNRGCPFMCNFCISSFHNYPFRNRSYENIISSLKNAIDFDNFHSVSLIGSCVSAHPRFLDVCNYIINNGKRLMIPSIRIDHLNDKVIKILETGQIKTITIAPETASEELRFELNKKITNKQIYSLLEKLRNSKINNVKMYFLIGLPSETEKEIYEIIKMIEKFEEFEFSKNSLRISINPIIPKLNTPYEKYTDLYLEENLRKLIKKLKILKEELKNLYSVDLKLANPKTVIKEARLQTLFSLGDENISELLLEYYKNGANFGSFKRAEKILDFSPSGYLKKIKECYSPWKI